MAVFRPGVSGEAGAHGGLVVAFDQMGGVIAVPDRTAEHDDAVVDQPVHEGGMLIPAVLVADVSRLVPGRAVNERAQEVLHDPDARRSTRQRSLPAEAADPVDDSLGGTVVSARRGMLIRRESKVDSGRKGTPDG